MKSIWLVCLCASLAMATDPTALAVYPIWNVPNQIVASDFDGDGNLDQAELNAANTVTIMLGSAPLSEEPITGIKQQSFRFKESYQTGMTPRSIRAADLNGDGRLDLAVANHGSNNVSVFLSKGKGAFKPAGTYGAGSGPTCLAVADLNSDGRLDLVVSNEMSADLSVLLGKGDGTFARTVSLKIQPLTDSIAVADFNNDGKADLAVTSTARASAEVITVMYGRGDGTFANAVVFRGVSGPRGIVIGERLPGTL
jgi:FG-GAP-like repeat/FG-GAP repeat/EF hand